MESDRRRAKTLGQIARLRRIERVRAIRAVSAAGAEATRVEELAQRSKAMLECEDSARRSTDAHGLQMSLAYQHQLVGLARSTETLMQRAGEQLKQAQNRLGQTEQRLKTSEEREVEAKRELARKANAKAATDINMARRLHRQSRSSAKQGTTR